MGRQEVEQHLSRVNPHTGPVVPYHAKHEYTSSFLPNCDTAQLHSSLCSNTAHALPYVSIKCSLHVVVAQWRTTQRTRLSLDSLCRIGYMSYPWSCLCCVTVPLLMHEQLSNYTSPMYTSSNRAMEVYCDLGWYGALTPVKQTGLLGG